MRISVFGTGYVGLVAAACFADAGHHVFAVDVDESRIAELNNGRVPMVEPGLDLMIERNVAAGRLRLSADVAEGVESGQILFIAVGTPSDNSGAADVSDVLSVASAIGQHTSEYKLVVNKSTAPVGTADKVRAAIATALQQRDLDVPFDVCSNPEFLREGRAIDDFTKAERIVVGTDSEHVRELIRECYAPYNRKRDKLLFMDVRSAELTKYAANAMLAARISLMNEFAALAEILGADIEQVRRGIGSDSRIGHDFLYPGCGFGGSCLPKDLRALIHTASQVGHDAPILRAVELVNRRQKSVLFEKLDRALNGELGGKTIAVWGLAFKANTNDMREAPSRELLEALWAAGARVQAYDPAAMQEAERIYGTRGDLHLCATREEAVMGADALVICTEWSEFRAVDFLWLKSKLGQPIVVDGRNLFEPFEAAQAGIRYYAVGRGGIAPET
jgi:UDPglucose 6-dehydrogenase